MTKKIWIIILGFICLAGLILAFYYLLFTKGSLVVNSNPTNEQFLFNNTTYYTPATIKNIRPGTYTLVAHNNGFKDEEYKVIISRLKTKKITLKMESLPLEKSILDEENKWDFSAESKKTNEGIEQIQNSHPLTKYLPYINNYIIFDYVVKGNSVEYFVEALPNKAYTKSSVISEVEGFISSKGISPDSIKIVWK